MDRQKLIMASLALAALVSFFAAVSLVYDEVTRPAWDRYVEVKKITYPNGSVSAWVEDRKSGQIRLQGGDDDGDGRWDYIRWCRNYGRPWEENFIPCPSERIIRQGHYDYGGEVTDATMSLTHYLDSKT